MTAATRSYLGYRIAEVTDAAGARRFRAVLESVYDRDHNWVPPLPGEEHQTFDPRRNPSLVGMEWCRWVLLDHDRPVGRVAAFAPGHRPGLGYFGFFECPPVAAAARVLLDTAVTWLARRGRPECYGPIAVTPRDRIGLLLEGFTSPALLFTPYNPPYYAPLLEQSGWSAHRFLRAYGWEPGHEAGPAITRLAAGASRSARIRIRPLRRNRLGEETRLIARLVNETLAEAWHFDPISEREAADMARLLRPVLDPAIALLAEDEEGPCAVALGMPDMNWLWRRAGGRLWPAGWLRLLRWRRHVPQARCMALGLAARVRRSGLAIRLIDRLHHAGVQRGYRRGEMSQVYEDNHDMLRVLERLRFRPVRRYAVFSRTEGS